MFIFKCSHFYINPIQDGRPPQLFDLRIIKTDKNSISCTDNPLTFGGS